MPSTTPPEILLCPPPRLHFSATAAAAPVVYPQTPYCRRDLFSSLHNRIFASVWSAPPSTVVADAADGVMGFHLRPLSRSSAFATAPSGRRQFNPECAEERCPAQPAGECPGTLWSAGPVDADLQKIGCASSPCALLAMISRTTAAAGSLSMISHSPSPPRHRQRPLLSFRAHKRNEYWSLARAHGVIGLSQRKRRNRAKSPSVE